MSGNSENSIRRSDIRLVLLLILVAAALSLAGIRRDLPHVPEADEPILLTAATHIAASGDLNPQWFGHPGSTMVYPLALGVHAWHGLAHGGRLMAPDPNLVNAYPLIAPELFLLGRLLAVAYAVLCVPLVYLVGRRAFGRRQALLGAAFAAILPIAVSHAQIVRTDSAATFFAILALWRCLVLLDQPRTRNQVWAGVAIGLAVATRYFMLTLVPVLIVVDAVLLMRAHRSGGSLRTPLVGMAIGMAAVPIAFSISSPYVILDFGTVLSNLRHEARTVHLGSDSLSRLGNLVWYPSRAVPEAMTLPLAVLAAIGLAHSVWRRNLKALVLLAFPVVLVLAISMSALHWTRWIIQALPILALLAADGLIAITAAISDRAGLGRRAQGWLLAVVVIIVALPAFTEVAWNDVHQARQSTRLQARRWLLDAMPPNAKVGLEWWTAPMFPEDFQGFVAERKGSAGVGEGSFEVEQHWHLPAAGTVDDLRREGFDYLVVSGNWFGPVMQNEESYPREAAFYRELFESGPPIAEFTAERNRGGPLIRVYELGEQ